jgi:hypothetical protein
MIIYHQSNIAAFAGNHVFYWIGQPFLHPRITITSAAAAVTLIAQSRTVSRFVSARVYGRVN